MRSPSRSRSIEDLETLPIGETAVTRRRFSYPHLAAMTFTLVGLLVTLMTRSSSASQETSVTTKNTLLRTTTTKQDEGLGIIWLMSFPNSGTSFTSKLVRHVTLLSTGTNYGEETDEGESIFQNDGPPFWIDPHSLFVYQRPSRLVLVKTHCGGRCELCGPQTYIENPHSFLYQCLAGRKLYLSSNGTKFVDPQLYSYNASLVRKAIHLIRNPLDNIVSRFHLEQHSFAKRGNKTFTSDRQGFRDFCNLLERNFGGDERHSRWMDPQVMETLKTVPCHADVIRYVQWHNLAHIVTQDLGIPTLVLFYEDYRTKFSETLHKLVEFLEVPQKGEAADFVGGKEYVNYFTRDERRATREAIQQLALKGTWKHLEHYFEDDD